MAKYKYLLFDNDGTIMDFAKAEEMAFEQTYNFFNFSENYSEKFLNSYSSCNQKWWEKLELGMCTKEELVVGRFAEFLSQNNLMADPYEMNEKYKFFLSQNNQLIDGALELLEELSKSFRIIIITNGIASTQHARIENSPIMQYVDELIISEETGFAKPDKRFFEYTLEKSGIKDKSECLIIGDSLSSDIQGANNIGIDCIWYNVKKIKNKKCTITYEANTISEIYDIILDKNNKNTCNS